MPPQPETANSTAPQEAPKATTSPAPSSSPRSVPDGTTTKAKLGAISPPLPWPSPQIQEIARPMHRRFPTVPPEVRTPPTMSAPVPEKHPLGVPTTDDPPGESALRPGFLSQLRTQSDQMAQVFRRCRQRASEALLSSKAALGKLPARVLNAYQLSKLRRQIDNVEGVDADAEHAGAAQVDPASLVETGSASRPSFLARLGSERDQLARVFESCRQRASEALLSTKAAAGKLQARVLNAYRLSKLRRQIDDVESMDAEPASAAPVDPALSVETEQSVARERALSLLASVRIRGERAIGYTRLKCGRALVTTRDAVNTAVEAASAFRVKIRFRLPKNATIRTWLARPTDAKLRLDERDSRLWISMGMAALSAVLALLVISGVRGYAPDAQPSKISRSGSATPVVQPAATVAAQPTVISVTKPSPATRSRTSEPSAPVVKRASLSRPAHKAAALQATRKKMHHREEDDYVAKDTYVYYGLNGKTTR